MCHKRCLARNKCQIRIYDNSPNKNNSGVCWFLNDCRTARKLRHKYTLGFIVSQTAHRYTSIQNAIVNFNAISLDCWKKCYIYNKFNFRKWVDYFKGNQSVIFISWLIANELIFSGENVGQNTNNWITIVLRCVSSHFFAKSLEQLFITEWSHTCSTYWN